MNRWSYMWWLLTFALLSGCNGEGEVSGVAAQSGAGFEPFRYENRLPSCSENPSRCAHVSITLPSPGKMENPAVRQAINELLCNYLRDALAVFDCRENDLDQIARKAADQLFAEYREMTATQPDYAIPWWLEVEGKLIWWRDDLVSMELMQNAFAGGAHPNRSTSFFSLDLNTGGRLTWAELIEDEPALLQLAERKFRQSRGLLEGQSLQDAGFFWGKPFHLPENFALVKEGLRFYYNPYEVAPYAKGETIFTLTYEELQGLIKLPR